MPLSRQEEQNRKAEEAHYAQQKAKGVGQRSGESLAAYHMRRNVETGKDPDLGAHDRARQAAFPEGHDWAESESRFQAFEQGKMDRVNAQHRDGHRPYGNRKR